MKMNTEWMMWMLLGVGCLPYLVRRQAVVVRRGRRQGTVVRWQVRAIFWRLTLERPVRGRATWVVTVPLIEHLRKAVWAALRQVVR